MDTPTGGGWGGVGGGSRFGWAFKGGGGRSFGLSARVGESKRNSFGMFSLHGCAGKSTTVREKKYSIFSSSVALPQAEVFRELKGGCREVNGGLTLWFKQGTRPVSLKHVCRGSCYEHG